jgi:hypothetical protein
MTDPSPVQAPPQGDQSVLPTWHTPAAVTRHNDRIHLRAGFSEILLPLADALVLAAELLEACGYTYAIDRIEPTEAAS